MRSTTCTLIGNKAIQNVIEWSPLRVQKREIALHVPAAPHIGESVLRSPCSATSMSWIFTGGQRGNDFLDFQ